MPLTTSWGVAAEPGKQDASQGALRHPHCLGETLLELLPSADLFSSDRHPDHALPPHNRRQPCVMNQAAIHRWIKTDCGRAKYNTLAAKRGALAKLRLVWFVLIAAIRDAPLPNPDQQSS